MKKAFLLFDVIKRVTKKLWQVLSDVYLAVSFEGVTASCQRPTSFPRVDSSKILSSLLWPICLTFFMFINYRSIRHQLMVKYLPNSWPSEWSGFETDHCPLQETVGQLVNWPLPFFKWSVVRSWINFVSIVSWCVWQFLKHGSSIQLIYMTRVYCTIVES